MAFLGLGKQRTTIGLDVGSGLVKLVAVDHGGSEPEISQVHMTEVLADAIVEGEIMDAGIVADAIKGLFATAGVKEKKVVTAVGGRDVIMKKIQVDRMKESEAYEVVRWEAQQYVPFDIDGVELDFQILDPEDEGLQMDVLLVAAKRELVEGKHTLLEQAGLRPSIIDVDAFALHNAFEINYPEAVEQVVGLLNIGHEVTNVNIVERGVPVLTRDLNVGTRKFREDLQRERGMSAEDADALLRGFERSPDLDPYVQSRGDEIAVGVERAAAFLHTASRDTEGVKQLFVAGGGARIPGITEVLQQRLNLPVEVVNPLQRVRVQEGVFDTVNVDEVAPLLTLGIGLALRRN